MSRRPMIRRRALSLVVGAATLPRLRADDSARDYVANVEFLLSESEMKARALLALKTIDWKAVSAEFRKAAAEISDAPSLSVCATGSSPACAMATPTSSISKSFTRTRATAAVSQAGSEFHLTS